MNKIFLITISLFCTTVDLTAQVKNVKYVIFIGCDGMGAYAVDKSENPTMQMMMKHGAYSLKAQSCLPSSSAVNWASHLMGASPEEHGYRRWNSKTPDTEPKAVTEFGMFPTVFYALKKQRPQLTSAVVYEWSGINSLFEKECVNEEIDCSGDVETVNTAVKTIQQKKPNLLFIHFNGPDSAGHEIGFESKEFYQKVQNVDAYIAKIISTTKKAGTFHQTVFIVSADHGGRRKDHGEDTPVERQVPWILYGKAIKKKGEIKSSIMVYNTAPTIAWLFGIKPPQPWIGKAITTPFGKR